MDADKIKAYYAFNADLWRFTRGQLETLADTDPYWDSTFRMASGLLKKHGRILDEQYIRQSINAVINELERISRERRMADGQAGFMG